MDKISIPLIKANELELLGVKVMFSLKSSTMSIQNSLNIVSSGSPSASAVSEALKSRRRVKVPALTEKRALERSKLLYVAR